MTEEVAELLKRALALSLEAREELATSLLKSLSSFSANGAENRWVSQHRKKALAGLHKAGRTGFMEAYFHYIGEPIKRTQSELVRAAEKSSIHAFGWPIAVVLHTPEGQPKPMADGIVAEISGIDSSYDYWALRTNGDFYFLGSLFEDERTKNVMWFDTRIMRATETFLLSYRLYKAIAVAEENSLNIRIRYGGLMGRVLSSAKPAIWALNRTSHEEEVEWEATMQLAEIRTKLQQTVKASLDPLFMLFDFFQPPNQQVYSQVEEFLNMVSRQQAPFDL
jgi:hypothetical protein